MRDADKLAEALRRLAGRVEAGEFSEADFSARAGIRKLKRRKDDVAVRRKLTGVLTYHLRVKKADA